MSLEEQLSPQGLDLYRARLIRKKLPEGQAVLDKGMPISGAYFVLEGQLRVYTLSESGKEATLYTISPGETCVLALNSLFNDFLYPAWVVADQNTTVGVLPGPVYRDLFRKEPAIQDLTVRALSSTVFGLMAELEQHHVQTVRQRLAGYIVTRCSTDFILSTTQQKIADDLGSSREFIARILSDFSRRKLVRTGRGKILVLDCEGLNQIRQETAE